CLQWAALGNNQAQTTSPLRGTPPKNSSVIFKRRVIALIGSIVPPIHCMAGGELGLRIIHNK
ncbi:MAG: hypothetical protein J6B30_05380, partial [Muribaculaceae bacterium]|nr:hypothetical protein [Muribaculaceae bacterium]